MIAYLDGGTRPSGSRPRWESTRCWRKTRGGRAFPPPLPSNVARSRPGERQMTVTNTVPPAISGTAQQGHVLSTTNGAWTFDLDYLTYAYEWLRCDALGANCSAIANQVSSTYWQQQTWDTRSALKSLPPSTPSRAQELAWTPRLTCSTIDIPDTGPAPAPYGSVSQPWTVTLHRPGLHPQHRDSQSVRGVRSLHLQRTQHRDNRRRDLVPAAAGNESYRREALVFHNVTGTIHVEGVLATGTDVHGRPLRFISNNCGYECHLSGAELPYGEQPHVGGEWSHRPLGHLARLHREVGRGSALRHEHISSTTTPALPSTKATGRGS